MEHNFVSYSDAQTLMSAIGKKFDDIEGGLIFKGSIAFSALPTLTADKVGYFYNINEEFTTTSDFIEGAGKTYGAGTNVAIIDTALHAYNEVTPIGNENPYNEHWYEYINERYVLTFDTEVNDQKTYFAVATPVLYFDVISDFIDVEGIEDSLKAIQDMIAPAFDTATAYSVGNYVVYNEVLYQFTSAHSAGAWVGSDAEEVTITDKIAYLTSEVAKLGSNFADAFSTVTNYSATDVVVYENKLYRFTTDHSADTWNSNDVEEITVEDLAVPLTSNQMTVLLNILNS